MTLWIIVPYDNWDGHGLPTAVFSTEAAAKNFVKSRDDREQWDVVELELDKEGA